MRRNISNICLIVLPIIYILIYELYLFSNYMKHIEFISAAFSIILLSLAVFLLGFRKNKENLMMKNIKRMIITYLVMFFSIAYASGLLLGFLENGYSLDMSSIINNTFAPIVTIICIELFRYVFIKANTDKLIIIKIMTFILIIFEFLLSIRLSNLNGFNNIFKITTSIALPIIMKNITLSYLSYHVGYQSTLLYRLVMDVYIFVAPILPDLGEYINSVVGVGLPFLIYFKTSKIIDERDNGVEHEFLVKTFGAHDFVIIGIIGCLTLLCSGMLPWYVIGIASESMNPQITRGDAVLIKKIDSPDELKEGNIISFYKEGKEIVHRFVEINEKDGEICYITKGDANQTVDMGCLAFEDIKGIVKTKVPFVAYPKVFLSELFD